MQTKFVLGVLILLLATCSMRTPTPTDSGIEGQVMIGPMCPVVQVGQDCAPSAVPGCPNGQQLEGRKNRSSRNR